MGHLLDLRYSLVQLVFAGAYEQKIDGPILELTERYINSSYDRRALRLLNLYMGKLVNEFFGKKLIYQLLSCLIFRGMTTSK